MTILKTSEVLAKAKALIVDPENWMQGDYTDGNKCFCSLGALAVALKEEEFNIDGTAPARLLKEVVANSEHFIHSAENFAAYNDRATHTEVMHAFDKAILLAVQRGD